MRHRLATAKSPTALFLLLSIHILTIFKLTQVAFLFYSNMDSGCKIRDAELSYEWIVGEHLCVLPPIITYHMTITLMWVASTMSLC